MHKLQSNARFPRCFLPPGHDGIVHTAYPMNRKKRSPSEPLPALICDQWPVIPFCAPDRMGKRSSFCAAANIDNILAINRKKSISPFLYMHAVL